MSSPKMCQIGLGLNVLNQPLLTKPYDVIWDHQVLINVNRSCYNSSHAHIFNYASVQGLRYRKTSNISRTLAGTKIVDNSDVVGASPDGVAPTTSSFSTEHLASMD